MMISKALEAGVTQRQIAKDSGVPASAINRLLMKFDGVGTVTGRQFGRYFRYPTFSEFMAAADSWWDSDGEAYARDHQRARIARVESELKEARDAKKPPEPIIYTPPDAKPKAG